MGIKNAAELREARQKRKELRDRLVQLNKPEMTPDEERAWSETKGEYDSLDADILTYESAQERNQVLSEMEERAAHNGAQAPSAPGRVLPAGTAPAQPRSNERLRVFSNLGEQLAAVRRQAMTGQIDERLVQLENEARALGNQVGVGADFGFAVQSNFTEGMLESAAQAGEILSRVDRYEVGENSDSARWMDIEETDVSTTVFGGVQVYWAAEGKTVAASKPEVNERKIDLEKLMGFAYATEETLRDTNFASQLYGRAFTLAINRTLEGNVVDGNGVGKPLGITKGPALVTVSKESGQASGTIDVKNFIHMWGRLLPDLRRDSVWLMHPDLEEILPLMTFPVGTGGVPVYLPAGGISESPLASLYGRPIIPTDHCAALSSKGDVILTALKEYVLIGKGGIQSAASVHVAFLTAENCFRVILRANGAPKRKSAIKIKNSSNLRSAYVTLEAR